MKFNTELDTLVLVAVALLCIIGLCLIYSILQPHQNSIVDETDFSFFNRQLTWMIFGVVALTIGMAMPFRYYEALALLAYIVCLGLLVVVLFVGSGPTARWLEIGPLRLQPSEFTKIALLFLWGRILSGHASGADRAKKIMTLVGVTAVPFLLVLKQPDLGTAIIFLAMLLPVMYWRGLKGEQIFFIVSPIIAAVLIIYSEEIRNNPWPFGIYIVVIFIIAYFRRSHVRESLLLVASNLGVGLLLPIAWGHLKVYQQQRILNFLDPESDKLGAGWQVFQSKIAIGSGGISGKGFLQGTQKSLEFLPAKHTDFVFSVLGEEMGFVGALFVMVLFGVLVTRALAIAEKAKSQFASTVCVGIAAYFFFQVFINIAMVTGMAPVTGIPIPFLSYGGSSLMVSCFFIGFLLNCSMRWSEY